MMPGAGGCGVRCGLPGRGWGRGGERRRGIVGVFEGGSYGHGGSFVYRPRGGRGGSVGSITRSGRRIVGVRVCAGGASGAERLMGRAGKGRRWERAASGGGVDREVDLWLGNGPGMEQGTSRRQSGGDEG